MEENIIEHERYWTKKEPRKALATYQRNQNKLLINMLNMMDRKAGMMIRINTTLVSGIVVFFEHISELEGGKVIGIVIVVFSFVSLVSALLAAKPPVTKFSRKFKKKVISKYPERSKNIFLVGLTTNLTIEEYEESFNELVNSQALQIGNQVRTHYVFEEELKLGFKILEFAYNSFITGFLIAIILFLFHQLS